MARVHTGESVLARAARVVEAFGIDDASLTVSEIARRADLHIATASRIIEELVRCGWLERDGRQVRVGVRLWEISSRSSPTVNLREAARPFMEDLHAVVDQHTQLEEIQRRVVPLPRLRRRSSAQDALERRRVDGRRHDWAQATLTNRLGDEGLVVLDVPAKLAARVRLLSTGHGRKSVDADAVSVGIAALTGHGLTSARMDGAVTALRAIVEHRDDLVKTRTQTVNRLHVVLTHLVSAGAPGELGADQAAELLRSVRPRDAAGKTMPGLAVEPHRRDPSTGSADRQSNQRDRDSGRRFRQYSDRVMRDRDVDRRQDPCPGRFDSPVPFRGRVRFLHRRRPDRSVLRRHHLSPALSCRRPTTQLLSARHGDHPDRTGYARPHVLPAQRAEGKIIKKRCAA